MQQATQHTGYFRIRRVKNKIHANCDRELQRWQFCQETMIKLPILAISFNRHDLQAPIARATP